MRFLFVLFASAMAVTSGGGYPACTATHAELIGCFDLLLDTAPKDGTVTLTELQDFLSTQGYGNTSCVSSDAQFQTKFSAQNIMDDCDVNGDSQLTTEDWNSPNGCANTETYEMVLCSACKNCGWSNP